MVGDEIERDDIKAYNINPTITKEKDSEINETEKKLKEQLNGKSVKKAQEEMMEKNQEMINLLSKYGQTIGSYAEDVYGLDRVRTMLKQEERMNEEYIRTVAEEINMEEAGSIFVTDPTKEKSTEKDKKKKEKTTKQTRDPLSGLSEDERNKVLSAIENHNPQKIIEDMKYKSLFEETWKEIENKISEIQAYFENEKELPEKVEKEAKKKIIGKMAEKVYRNKKDREYESRGRVYKEKDDGYIEKAVRLLKEIFKKDKEETPEIDKIEKEAYGFTEDEARELARKYGIDRIPHEGDTEINSIPQDKDKTPPQTIKPYPQEEPERVPEQTCRMDERIIETYKEAYIQAINEVKENCKKTGFIGKIKGKLKGKWSIDTKKLEKWIETECKIADNKVKNKKHKELTENVAKLEAYLDVLEEVKGEGYVEAKYQYLRNTIEMWKACEKDIQDLKNTTVLAYEPGIFDKTSIYKAVLAGVGAAYLVDAALRGDITAPIHGLYNLITGVAGPDKITLATALGGIGTFLGRVYSGIRDFEKGRRYGKLEGQAESLSKK